MGIGAELGVGRGEINIDHNYEYRNLEKVHFVFGENFCFHIYAQSANRKQSTNERK